MDIMNGSMEWMEEFEGLNALGIGTLDIVLEWIHSS